MNLHKQVEPLLLAALQASSEQRHAQHAASRLAWLLHRLRRASETITSQAEAEAILTCRSAGGQGALTACFAVACASPSSTSCSSRKARSFSSPRAVDCDWRARKYSSAILRATRMARPRISLAGAASAAARIFPSTYAASSATYRSSSALRMG